MPGATRVLGMTGRAMSLTMEVMQFISTPSGPDWWGMVSEQSNLGVPGDPTGLLRAAQSSWDHTRLIRRTGLAVI